MSPFLDLPAELRNRCYEYALAPTGTLHLTSSATHRYSVKPQVSPALLATCHKIHSEARQILYSQNSVCVVCDGQAVCAPIIARSRLPATVSRKLEEICLIFDCTATFRTPFDELDLSALSELTALKKARIAVLLRTDSDASSAAMRACLGVLLKLMLDKFPPQAKVDWGVEPDTAEEGVVEMVRVARQSTFRREQGVNVVNISGAELKGMIEGMRD